MDGIYRPFLRIATALFMGCPLVFPVLGQSQEKPKGTETETTLAVAVKRVIDGDSILVLDPKDNDKEYEVQLEGLDAPELKQEFGKQSSEALAKLIEKKELRISWKSKDNFERLLAQVYVGNTHINSEMLKSGMAWHFKRYNKSEALAKLEVEAKEAKKGLWKNGSPTAPWDYRKENKAPDKPAK
jgi:endonuclease YncB( thermonuclease family)